MTTETRSSIELTDVMAFEMECSKCHARTIRRLDRLFEVPVSCGNCGPGWMIAGSAEYGALKEFIEQLYYFRKDSANKNFILRVEVTGLQKELLR